MAYRRAFFALSLSHGKAAIGKVILRICRGWMRPSSAETLFRSMENARGQGMDQGLERSRWRGGRCRVGEVDSRGF